MSQVGDKRRFRCPAEGEISAVFFFVRLHVEVGATSRDSYLPEPCQPPVTRSHCTPPFMDSVRLFKPAKLVCQRTERGARIPIALSSGLTAAASQPCRLMACDPRRMSLLETLQISRCRAEARSVRPVQLHPDAGVSSTSRTALVSTTAASLARSHRLRRLFYCRPRDSISHHPLHFHPLCSCHSVYIFPLITLSLTLFCCLSFILYQSVFKGIYHQSSIATRCRVSLHRFSLPSSVCSLLVPSWAALVPAESGSCAGSRWGGIRRRLVVLTSCQRRGVEGGVYRAGGDGSAAV